MPEAVDERASEANDELSDSGGEPGGGGGMAIGGRLQKKEIAQFSRLARGTT